MITSDQLTHLKRYLAAIAVDMPAGSTHVKAMQAAISTLEALPETADGVRVVPFKSTTWHPIYGKGWLASRTHGSFYTEDRPSGPATLVPLSECYSSEEAMTAARDGDSK